MPKHSLQSHTIRIHPTLWQWAKEDAGPCGYDPENASALISGLILYNRAVGRRHWLTADLVNDLDKLEAVMREIEERNPLAEGTTWLEHRLREIFGQTRPSSKEERNPS